MRRLIALSLFLSACSSTEPPAAPSAEAATKPEPAVTRRATRPVGATKYFAPTPYTSEQIRFSNPPGTRTVYRVEAGDRAPVFETTWFVTDDGKYTHIESETADIDGNALGAIERWGGPWTELRDHAKFPAAHTKRSQEVIETELGSLACHLYVVNRDHEGAPATHRFWFDVEAAGSPVAYEIEQDGSMVFHMELIEENRRRLED